MVYRHGDILLKRVTKPKGQFKTKKNYVVALGEHTGHKHQLDGEVGLLEREAIRYLDFVKPTPLKHEEHKTLVIEPGTYEVIHEREFDYFQNEIAKVQD